ncbi:MAG: M1 family metallopeptidase [Caldilineales bacterium]|nr:M1 family metallopeptidase [Caldilineales bacterium]
MTVLPRRFLRHLLWMVGLVAVLAGCQGWPLIGRGSPPPDPLAAFRLAMMPDQAMWVDREPPWPVYRIRARLDPAELALTGDLTLTLPADFLGPALSELYFRLYPNLAHYAGQMAVDLVTVNGQGAAFEYRASDTAVRVLIPPAAIRQGEPTAVGLRWRLRVRSWPPNRYTLLGESEGVISLPLFYPILAGRQPGVADSWRLDLGLVQGDAAFTETALYDVTLEVPADYRVVGSGSVLAVTDVSSPAAEGEEPTAPWRAWRIVTGPVREMALFVSDRLQLAESTAYGVQINSWYLPGDEAAGRAAADYAAAALRIYHDVLGPYPYRELDVVAGPLTYRGMEYPGLFVLGFDLYRSHADEMEFRVAHEMAHQWWYNLVGNDPVNAPWLDEGLAEFSTYYYRLLTRGEAAAERLAATRWRSAVAYAHSRGLDAVVNQPVQAFLPSVYETMVYGKAALFFYELYTAVGAEAFQGFLRDYIEAYRFGVATPDGFIALAEERLGPVARELYDRLILSAEGVAADGADQPQPTPPTPSPTP